MGQRSFIGDPYDTLASGNQDQSQKIEDAVSDLTHFFELSTVTVPSEEITHFLVGHMLDYQYNSWRSYLGFVPGPRACLIRASKLWADHAFKNEESSTNWSGIKNDVVKIIDKYF